MKTTKTALIALGLLLSGQLTKASEIYQTPPAGRVGIMGAVTNEQEAETLRRVQQRQRIHHPLQPMHHAPVAGTPAQVGHLGHGPVHVPTGYQAPVAGTEAQIGYQAQPETTKGQIYQIPTVTEESLK